MNYKLIFILITILLLSCILSKHDYAQTTSEDIIIGKKIQLQSKILNEEREIFINLPDGYEQSHQKYPVLYILDGEWNFEFAVAIEGFLCSIDRMPEMIVVGIPNTDRFRDFTTNPDRTGGADNFIKFLEVELIPYIDSSYRTYPHRILYGHSAGGTVSIYALFAKPDLFNGYIAVSPYLGPWEGFLNVNEFAQQVLEKCSSLKKSLFVTLGDEPSYTEHLSRFFNLLERTSPKDFEWKYTQMKTEDHSSVPLKSLYAGLESLYSDWIVPENIAEQGAKGVKEHYDKLSERFGYQVGLPEDAISQFISSLLFDRYFRYYKYEQAFSIFKQLKEQYQYKGTIHESRINRIGNQLLQDNKYEEAISAFKFNVELYPESANVYNSLGDAYEKASQLELAKKNYEIAYQKAKEANDSRLQTFKDNLDRVLKKIEEKSEEKSENK